MIFIIFKSTPEARSETTEAAGVTYIPPTTPRKHRERGDTDKKYSANISNIPRPGFATRPSWRACEVARARSRFTLRSEEQKSEKK